MIKKVCLLVVLLCFSCTNNTRYKAVSVEELQSIKQQDTIQLVDVRTSREYNGGYIEGAVLIDVMSNNFVNKAKKELNTTTPVYLYCRSGRRSIKAAELLEKEGYKVKYLEGGYTAWHMKTKNK